MMILLNRPVVVEKSRLRAGHDVEVIGRASVFEIVDDGGEDSGENFQIRQPVLGRERMKENAPICFNIRVSIISIYTHSDDAMRRNRHSRLFLNLFLVSTLVQNIHF